MCGIAGLWSFVAPAQRAPLIAAGNALAKRGPDDEGTWLEGGLGFSHRRLSVLDTSDSGHQPMLSRDGRLVIVFNGEIYNFKELKAELGGDWQSCGDTEVILRAYAKWGADCLPRLRGMFAFAIFDRTEQVLFLARDRMGVKPLFFAHTAEGFAFASRPRALGLLVGGLDSDIDLQGLRHYLEIGYFPGSSSLFRKIRRCPAGHYMRLSSSGLEVQRYWNPAEIRPNAAWVTRREDDLLDELDAVVRRSVKARLVSDVPLGAFLSGGIDSSLVVAVMRGLSNGPITTFTMGFNEPTFDESRYAAAVASHLQVQNRVEHLKVPDLLALMPMFGQEYDEPFFDSSAFPSMALSRLARRHVTVSLSGDGGDELFGGYHYYRIVGRLRALYRLPRGIREFAAAAVGIVPGHRSELLSSAMRRDEIVDAFPFIRSISKDFPSVVVPEVIAATQSIRDLFVSECQGRLEGLPPEEQAMRLDMLYTLPDDYLQKLDVASMAFSLEAREPLLDQDLVEWAMQLPLCWKIRNGEGKYLLKRLAYRYIPRHLLDRPKKGFEVPISAWLRGPLRPWALERLTDRTALQRLHLDPAAVNAIFQLHCSGKRQAHPILWAILMLVDFVSNRPARGINELRSGLPAD